MQRRHFNQKTGKAAIAAFATLCCALTRPRLGMAASDLPAERFRQRMQAIEQTSGGRLGVAVLDTHTGAAFAHRGSERFPLCSTFKFLAAAQVLARVDSGADQLDRRIAVQASDLIPYAPVTQPRVGGEPMTLAELCDAAVTLSDNVAGNLLLRSLGGPAAVTAYLRGLGDTQTRLDRTEPDLNQALPGDLRDTTTPEAMLQTLHKIVLGAALSPASRVQIVQWLVDNKTGDRKIRAALPSGWRAGDKTGAGAFGTNNDIAVLWRPGPMPMRPVLVTAYLTDTSVDQAARDFALAEVGRLVVKLVTDTA